MTADTLTPADGDVDGPTDARRVRRAHETFLSSGADARPGTDRRPATGGVRGVVARSWARSQAAGVDVDRTAAGCALPSADLTALRDAHPLSPVFPLLYDVLGRAAEECESLLAIGDARGRLLWVCGRPGVLARAEAINFAEGSSWAEADVGTNAPGTALRLDAPVQILGPEHFRRSVQQWSCTAAPIHDPVTRAVLGVVDVTGTDTVAVPQTMAMVRAAARMAEAELGRLAALGRLWTPPAQTTAHALGRPDCELTRDGVTVRLRQRHSELLVLLADRPDGVSGDELAVELYAGDAPVSTVRAELTRLRTLLGEEMLASRPYRLTVPPACDWRRVEDLVRAGRIADALGAYAGPLLPRSDAPGVVARREGLERALREAVGASGQPDLMAAWTRTRWGADDLELWQRQAALLPDGSPLRPVADAEVRRLDRELRG